MKFELLLLIKSKVPTFPTPNSTPLPTALSEFWRTVSHIAHSISQYRGFDNPPHAPSDVRNVGHRNPFFDRRKAAQIEEVLMKLLTMMAAALLKTDRQ